jgi:hypothetical protein
MGRNCRRFYAGCESALVRRTSRLSLSRAGAIAGHVPSQWKTLAKIRERIIVRRYIFISPPSQVRTGKGVNS